MMIFLYKAQSLMSLPRNTNPEKPMIATMAELEARCLELEMENQHLRRQNKRLHQEAVTDHLTGLYSRRFFNKRVLAMQSEARRDQRPDVFVLFIDVDHFKAINDQYGHETGDRVLTGIARRIKRVLRVTDVAARYGGEEIVILGRGDGQLLAKRLCSAMAKRPVAGVAVTVSVGLAYFEPQRDEGTMAATIARADAAMYRAKDSGRNCMVVAS